LITEISRGLEQQDMGVELLLNGYRVSVCHDENILEILVVVAHFESNECY
jgi:hypothetical protein